MRLVAFGQDRRGNILIFLALGIAVMIGAAGLGVEVASWYAQKRAMQNAADLAAEGAVLSLKNNPPGSSTQDGYAAKEGKTATSLHGYADGNSGTSVTVNIPPLSGSFTGSTYNHKAAEVIISKPATLYFASLFLPSTPTVGVRAVARIVPGGGDCMLATDPTASQAIAVIGNATVNVACGIADNSNASDALYMQGNATLITSTTLTVDGQFSHTGGAYTLSAGTSDIGNGSTITDPYASTKFPSLNPSCTNCTLVSKASLTALSGTSGTFSGGGVFTGALSVSGTLSLSDGVYYVDGGDLTVKNATLTTSNATIILTSSVNSSSIGTLQVDANGVLNLTAPSSSTSSTQGIAIMQDRSVTAGTDNHMQSNPTVTVVGAMYFPSGGWSMQGTPTWNATVCTQLIADTFTLHGNPGLSDTNCPGAGAKDFGPNAVKLAE
jgi:Flp pilus assembly protein TadG